MSFDALTLSAVRDELEPLLVDARVQKLAFTDELSVALEVFAPGAGRTFVLLSADLEHGRVQRLDRLPARGVERDTPFSLVLRKHLRNARIRSVRQPRLERVFEMDCEQRDASGQHYGVLFIVEVMGRRSNLVLVDSDAAIVDAARRAPPSRNPRRPILPHLRYDPPPPQDRLFPEEISVDRLAAEAGGRGGTLAKLLSDRLAGMSPLAGRELAFRITGTLEAPLHTVDWTHAVRVIHMFFEAADTHQWQPCVVFESEHPVAFAPYLLTHLGDAGNRLQPFESPSDALSAYYARVAEVGTRRRGDALAAERRALLAPLERGAHTLDRKIAALQQQLDSGHQVREPLRRAGEMLLAYQGSVPSGAAEVVLDGERIELDARLSAVENAQAYFARYRKAREAEERVPALLEQTRNQSAHVADLRALVELADQMDAIRALRREVAAATAGQSAGGTSKSPIKSAPYRRVPLGEGWEALVGTSAAGNATVTFDLARADDLWLHARGVPGAHVILRTNSTVPSDDVLERAAQLAAWHSAARDAGAVEVDVAERRHVKKIPNAAPGLVRYTHERTLRVTPHAASGTSA